jgi:DNA-directed RNA polymerase specialized sigma24 family protein
MCDQKWPLTCWSGGIGWLTLTLEPGDAILRDNAPHLAGTGGAPGEEARAVGEDAGGYAARRAAMARQYDELPPSGTAAWWRRIEGPGLDGDEPLAREVLARCVQECAQIGRLADAQRVITELFRRVEADIRRWARHCGARARGALNEDLQQECYMALWEELIAPGRTFLTEHFGHGLLRVQQHVGQALLLREGLRRRKGVVTPDRVPPEARVSLETAASATADGDPLPLADERALTPFEAAELSDLVEHVARLPEPDRTLIYSLYWLDETQDVAARRLKVATARTVYNRLSSIGDRLRVQYGERKEVTDGGAAR